MKIRILVLFLGAASLMFASRPAGEDTDVVGAARRFFDSLSAMQKAVAITPFEAEHRFHWHYFPDSMVEAAYGHARMGVSYKYLNDEQDKLAEELLKSGLSAEGLAKAQGVMKLEEILRLLENDTSGHRDREAYYFSMFGKPSAAGVWGWRFEGHHLSLNFTVKNGKLVSASPAFYGANPHTVLEGADKGMQVLAREDKIARQLVASLNEKQLDQAVLQEVAYPDILTFVDRRAKLENEPRGLPASELGSSSLGLLRSLVAEYAGNGSAAVKNRRMKSFDAAPREKILFAWTGSTGPGEGVYYRVQTPEFLIEYDNTQNQGNHSHSVWRDWDGDFGLDVLAVHHRSIEHGTRKLRAAK